MNKIVLRIDPGQSSSHLMRGQDEHSLLLLKHNYEVTNMANK